MDKHQKLLLQILHGRSDANTRFEELRGLLRHLGFAERVRGSHHIFHMSGVEELINIQRDGSKAKTYQVRQVRSILLRYNLGREPNA